MKIKWGGEELGLALEELAAFGCPVDLSVVANDLGLYLEQGGGLSDSIVFDLPYHRTGYILDVGEILNRRSTTIYLRDLELELPWEDPGFCWLPDPGTQNYNAKAPGKKLKGMRMQPTTPQYCFPCSDGLEFPRDQVLNHHLAENGKLTQRPMRGLLLAIGGRMPDTLRNGSLLEANLILRDVESNAYRHKVSFWIDRRAVATKPKSKNLGLFEPAPTKNGLMIADPGSLAQVVDEGNLWAQPPAGLKTSRIP